MLTESILRKFWEFCAKDFNYLARDPLLMIIQVENQGTEKSNMFPSEASFHGSATLQTGCPKALKHEDTVNLLEHFC